MDWSASTIAVSLIVSGMLGLWIYAARCLDAAPLASLDEPPASAPADQPLSEQYEQALDRLLAQMNKAGPMNTRLRRAREMMDEFGMAFASSAQFVPIDCAGLTGEWVVTGKGQTASRILYLHGGGFAVGSSKSHRPITTELSRRTGLPVLALDYRLMPEHRLSAQREDCRGAYEWILANGPGGPDPANGVIIAGDSAGGHHALMLAIWARDNDRPAARAVVTFAPATDAGLCGPSFRRNVPQDRFLGPALGPLSRIPKSVLFYLNWLIFRVQPTDKSMSPLRNNLAGLPPILVQASVDEMLYDDGARLVNKICAAGGVAELQSWTRRCHVFQILGAGVPEAIEALDLAANFVLEHLEGTSSARAPG